MTRSPRQRRPRAGDALPLLAAVLGVSLGGLLFAVALTLLAQPRGFVVLVDDGGQLVAACAATVLCAAAVRSEAAGARRS